jgi:hypothetical protein
MLIRARIATVRRTAVAFVSILALGACKLTSDAPRPQLLGITAGDAQMAPAGTELQVPLGVIVLDQFSVGVVDVGVTWAITSGGGSLSATSTTTNASGVTSVTYTAGPTPGMATITATVPQIGTLTFKETIT